MRQKCGMISSKVSFQCTYLVSRLENFLATTRPSSMPSLSTTFCARSGWEEPLKTLMLGILPPRTLPDEKLGLNLEPSLFLHRNRALKMRWQQNKNAIRWAWNNAGIIDQIVCCSTFFYPRERSAWKRVTEQTTGAGICNSFCSVAKRVSTRNFFAYLFISIYIFKIEITRLLRVKRQARPPMMLLFSWWTWLSSELTISGVVKGRTSLLAARWDWDRALLITKRATWPSIFRCYNNSTFPSCKIIVLLICNTKHNNDDVQRNAADGNCFFVFSFFLVSTEVLMRTVLLFSTAFRLLRRGRWFITLSHLYF